MAKEDQDIAKKNYPNCSASHSIHLTESFPEQTHTEIEGRAGGAESIFVYTVTQFYAPDNNSSLTYALEVQMINLAPIKTVKTSNQDSIQNILLGCALPFEP